MTLRFIVALFCFSTLVVSPTCLRAISTEALTSGDAGTRSAAAREAASLSEAERHKVVTALIQKLRGSDIDQKERAAETLGEMGPAAAEAVPALRQALKDDLPYVRVRSVQALARIGAPAVPAFIDALQNSDGDVRATAAGALAQIGEPASPAIPALLKALDDRDSTVRSRAATALEHIGAASATPVSGRLTDATAATRMAATRILGNVPTSPETLSMLAERLSDEDTQVRLSAMKALARKGRDAVEPLTAQLRASDPGVRSRAAETLGDLQRNGSSAVPPLIEALKDSEPAVRAAAARALGKIGPEATSAVPALRDAAKDSDVTVAARAADAITNLTATHKSEIVRPGEILGGMVTSAMPEVVEKTPMAATPAPATRIKPKLPKAAPVKAVSSPSPAALIKQLISPKDAQRTSAAEALAQLGPKALPALDDALASPNPALQRAAAKWLGTLGPVSAPAVPRLEALVKSPSAELREDALHALVAIDSAATISALTNASTDGDETLRLWSAHQFELLGPSASAGVPALSALLNDTQVNVSTTAASALMHIGTDAAKKALEPYERKQQLKLVVSSIAEIRKDASKAPQATATLQKVGKLAVPALTTALKDPSVTLRRSAASVLASLGREAAPARGTLAEALDDADPAVRSSAADALEKINDPQYAWKLRMFRMKEKARSTLHM